MRLERTVVVDNNEKLILRENFDETDEKLTFFFIFNLWFLFYAG